MNKSQLYIALTITFICFLGILSQQIWHCIVIDERTIFFIALGTLPWLTLFFRKFKIPGFEGETYDRDQSNTEKPLPPNKDASQVKTAGEISNESKKILATLWRNQKLHFKDNYTKRWTFTIFTNSTEYPNFIVGLSDLLKSGLVTGSHDNNQVYLTNEGIQYLNEHSDLQDYSDIYKF